jgi:hypothetical protein
MNLIDNGIKKVLSIDKIITPNELCFLVTFIDLYGITKQRKVMKFDSIEELEELRWLE